jgi:bacterioferritin
MKGDPKVLDILNEVLTSELTAINQFFLHAEICRDWGYEKLKEIFRKESIDAMVRAEKLIERILYLDGQPNMSRYFKINVGKNVESQMENNLKMEMETLERLKKGIMLCQDVIDDGSKELLEDIYQAEEDFIDWLETQFDEINVVGIKKYLAEQI